MTKQIKLIGNHPCAPNQFGRWLSVNDILSTPNKCHRELKELIPCDDPELIEWLAKKIVNHHYSDFRLKRLKENFKKLGFEKYAEQHRKLPIVDKVKKGNATEIILTEYIQSTLNKTLTKVFKLKYNPNVDQAIKGDDTLMVDLFEQNENKSIKVYLGESKFRKIPSRRVVDEISSSLEKEKMPLSYSFLVEEIAKVDEALALKLDDFILEDVKDRGNLIYTGLLLSDSDCSRHVENNLNNDNPFLVFISIGIDNPEDLIEKAFEKAEELVSMPEML